MAYEHREGSGSLFKNDKKGNEKAPDYRGDALVGGTLMEIAAWIKDGRNGKFMSLSIKPKDERYASAPAPAEVPAPPPATAPAGIADLDDDIPF